MIIALSVLCGVLGAFCLSLALRNIELVDALDRQKSLMDSVTEMVTKNIQQLKEKIEGHGTLEDKGD